MSVHCAECGEELMGSVNRCWRCGKEFVSRSGASDIPPLRRSPIAGPLQGPLEAVVLEDAGEPQQADGMAGTVRRRGSPFRSAAAADSVPGGERAYSGDAQAPAYPTGLGATGGAVAAIVLACIGLIVAIFFPLGAVILTAVGLGLGTWGLKSPRRGAAIAGMLLCCIGFTVSGVLLAYEVYVYLYL